MGVGASLSPTLSGLIVHHLGYWAGFVSLAGEGLIALVVLALFLPETKEDPHPGGDQPALMNGRTLEEHRRADLFYSWRALGCGSDRRLFLGRRDDAPDVNHPAGDDDVEKLSSHATSERVFSTAVFSSRSSAEGPPAVRPATKPCRS